MDMEKSKIENNRLISENKKLEEDCKDLLKSIDSFKKMNMNLKEKYGEIEMLNINPIRTNMYTFKLPFKLFEKFSLIKFGTKQTRRKGFFPRWIFRILFNDRDFVQTVGKNCIYDIRNRTVDLGNVLWAEQIFRTIEDLNCFFEGRNQNE